MWYWNKTNFEGLLAVAESISTEPRWSLFADYCTLREQGLRKQALASLDQLIGQAKEWSTFERRRFVNWIYETHLTRPRVHQLITNPLSQRLLIPVLEEWRHSDTTDATPRRWMGFATGDYAHFSEALTLNPQDDISRYRLVCGNLEDVDFQCHHLPEYFIGEPNDAVRLLEEARILSVGFCDPKISPLLLDEFATLNGKVNDWIAFQKTGVDSFSDWCKENGRTYKWLKAYYYDK